MKRKKGGNCGQLQTNAQKSFCYTVFRLLLLALIVVEAAVIATMLIIEPPGTELQFSKDLIRARLCCNTSQRGTIIPLAFPILLIDDNLAE
ncbi:hypothetical protein TSMEX_004277 [Taenia solium]|eukprot:TsM_001131500 transcript=TsM_001131500 gene=TsM_001131500